MHISTAILDSFSRHPYWCFSHPRYINCLGPFTPKSAADILISLETATGDEKWYCEDSHWECEPDYKHNTKSGYLVLLRDDILRLAGPLMSAATRQELGGDGWYLVAPNMTSAAYIGPKPEAVALACQFRAVTGDYEWSAQPPAIMFPDGIKVLSYKNVLQMLSEKKVVVSEAGPTGESKASPYRLHEVTQWAKKEPIVITI